MARRLERLPILLTALLLLASCVTQYTFEGQAFTNPQQAVATAQVAYASAVNTVDEAPADRQLSEPATIILLDRKGIEDKAIFAVGSGSVPQDQVNYLSEILTLDQASIAEAVARSQIFSSVDVRYDYAPEERQRDIDGYVIWLEIVSQRPTYFVRGPGIPETPLRVHHPGSISGFLNNLVLALDEEVHGAEEKALRCVVSNRRFLLGSSRRHAGSCGDGTGVRPSGHAVDRIGQHRRCPLGAGRINRQRRYAK